MSKQVIDLVGLGHENGANAMRECLQVKSVWVETVAVTAIPFVMR